MKNLLLLSAFLFTTSMCLAQLTVKPNGSADSYIYVKDQVLFVEQDVNLAINNPGTTEASIYLREGAQLIQGTTVAPNSGNGHLSVYQNAPDSDQWTYNYWSSPVGLADGTTGNTNFGVLRLYDNINTTASTQTLTTPGLNGTDPPLTISLRWLYTHPRGMELESDYVRFNATNTVATGLGFTMKGVNTAPVPTTGYEYDFRGRPNNGDITVQVYTGERTLSGNPYPSALDLNRLFYESGNDEIFQILFWDEDKDVNSHYYADYKGGYGTWIPLASDPNGIPGGSYNPGQYTAPTFMNYDAGGGTFPVGGGTGDVYPRRIAPIGQGFVIVADATGPITIKNSHRRFLKESIYSVFARPENNDTENSSPENLGPNVSGPTISSTPIDGRLPFLRLYTVFGENTHFRDMVLSFSNETTDGYDRGYDARHPMDSGNTDAYFPVGPENDKKPFVIQTVPFSIDKRVPIAFKLGAANSFKVKVVEQVKMPGQHVYLFDQQVGNYQQISDEEYAELTLPAGDYNNRFFIVFKLSPVITSTMSGLKGEILASVDFFQNNPAGQLEVSNPDGYEIKSASIYDMSGKLVISENNLGSSSKYTFYTGNLANGVYLVKLVTKEDISIDYKSIVNNK